MGSVEEFYQRIGQEARGLAPRDAVDILVYAEAERGVISVSEFYVSAPGEVTFLFASSSLERVVREFWSYWRSLWES